MTFDGASTVDRGRAFLMPSDLTLSSTPARPRGVAVAGAAFLAIAASITGIANRFAYDDVPLVAANDRVHTMHAWWMRFAEPYWPETFAHSLYRPITTLGFTLQWALGGGSPFVFHAVSMLLYAGCAVGVLLVAHELLTPAAAWFASALFAVHPVHVEAVANVVGQSELLAAIAVLFGSWWYLRARRNGAWRARDLAIVASIYAVGMLAKESAVVLPALLAAAELTVLRTADVQRRDRAGWIAMALVFALVAAAALCLRRAVIGAWLGDSPVPALRGLSVGPRLLTMLAASREWIRLLGWPSLLSFSYSPPYLPIVSRPGPEVVVGTLLLLAAVVAVIVTRRRAPAIAFGVLWFAIAILPVSNVFFVSGVFIAERTLFVPSVGFVLAVAAVGELVWRRLRSTEARRALVGLAALLLLAAGLRSLVRQPEWLDTGHIATAAARDLPEAYTVDALYAEYLATRRAAGTAEKWMRRSIALFPRDPETIVELASMYVDARLWPRAEMTFKQALDVDPTSPSARAGLVLCLVETRDYTAARAQAQLGLDSGKSTDTFRRLLTAIDSASKRP
jgi:hypothetical protein